LGSPSQRDVCRVTRPEPSNRESQTSALKLNPLPDRSLRAEPNNASPLNAQAAQLWENQEEYKKTLHKKYHDAK